MTDDAIRTEIARARRGVESHKTVMVQIEGRTMDTAVAVDRIRQSVALLARATDAMVDALEGIMERISE